MEFKFNIGSDSRKQMVSIISEILGVQPRYKFSPTFSYVIGEYTLTVDATLICENGEKLEQILNALYVAGFEVMGTVKLPNIENAATQNEEPIDGSAITISNTQVNVDNLTKIIAAKGNLIKKALMVDDLSFKQLNNVVAFNWVNADAKKENKDAFVEFIKSLCLFSKEQKRIMSKEKEYDNEKYAFRCFLLRLGFIGDEFKPHRKILMQNFTGNGAFKTVKKNEEVQNETSI